MIRCPRCNANIPAQAVRMVCLLCGDVVTDDTTDLTFTHQGASIMAPFSTARRTSIARPGWVTQGGERHSLKLGVWPDAE